jgi:glutathione transport system substrate-binding protein
MGGSMRWIACVSAAAVALLTACQPAAAPSPTAPPPPATVAPTAAPAPTLAIQPTQAAAALSGKLTVDLDADVESLDPYLAYLPASLSINHNLFDYLLERDAQGNLSPGLAESWSAVDPTTLEFKLRHGVKFHNGEDFNADAVQFSVQRMLDESLNSGVRSRFTSISEIKVVDPFTVRFLLSMPDPQLLDSLTNQMAMLPPKHTQAGSLASRPVGTGPFKFVEWKATDYLKVAKFDDYWRKGYPKVDTITWKPVVDNNSRAALIQTGEAHFTFPLPYELAEVLKTKPELDVVAAPSIVLRYLSMNTQQKPFDNPKVRQAIAYAINKEALAKVAFNGYATPADGMAPQGVEYAVKTGPWPNDLAKARQLLTEAGYPNGFETELWSAYNHTTAQKVTQFIQQQLQQVGIRTKITLLEAGQRVERVESWQDPKTAPVRLYYVGWSTSTGEADWALRPLLYGPSWPPALFNTAYYKSDKFDAAIKNAQLTTSATEKARLYKEAQETAWNDAPWAPLVVEKLLSANNKKLSGVYVIPDASFNFTDVDLK